MTPDLPSDHDFDQKITQALNNAPEIVVPINFAALVAASLPAPIAATPVRAFRLTYARRLGFGCVILLLASLFVLAARNQTPTPTIAEVILTVELVTLIAWLAYRRIA